MDLKQKNENTFPKVLVWLTAESRKAFYTPAYLVNSGNI